MGDKQVKRERSQLRNVVQEILPALLQTEVFKGLYEKLQKEVNITLITRLASLELEVRDNLKNLSERQQDIQAFIMNQVQSEMARNNPPTPAQLDVTQAQA